MNKYNLFFNQFKDFCSSNQVVINPQNVVEIQTTNGVYMMFPVNLDTILMYECN